MSRLTSSDARQSSSIVCSTSGRHASRPPLPACRTAFCQGATKRRTVLGCSAGDADKGAVVRTSALSSASLSFTAPSCPWPREAHFQRGLAIKERPSVLGAITSFWEALQREGDLPEEAQSVAYFSDGPGAGKKGSSEEQGLSRFWRHQGLRF